MKINEYKVEYRNIIGKINEQKKTITDLKYESIAIEQLKKDFASLEFLKSKGRITEKELADKKSGLLKRKVKLLQNGVKDPYKYSW